MPKTDLTWSPSVTVAAAALTVIFSVLLVDGLKVASRAVIAVDLSRERVEALRAEHVLAVCGNAAEPAALVQAHIHHASLLIITVGDVVAIRQMLDTARTLNPQIQVLVCASNAQEAHMLERDAPGAVYWAARELAQGLERRALEWS